MNIVDSILEKWNTDKDIESLIASGLLSDKDAIQTALDTLTGEEKTKVLSILAEIQTYLLNYIDGIEKNIASTKEQMNTTLKSEKACLSYGASGQTQGKRDIESE